MSKYLVDSTEMTAIANAIRTKDGTQTTMTVDEMPTRIQNIPSGGTDYMAERVQGTLSSYTIPNTCTRTSEYSLAYLPLTSITIPNNITEIGNATFYSSKLTSITIPSSVTKIGMYAFSFNSLTSVTFDSNLYALFGSQAFGENNTLTTLNNFSASIFKPRSSYYTLPYVPYGLFNRSALVGDITLGNTAEVDSTAFDNSSSSGVLYIHLTQTDITQLASVYKFGEATTQYNKSFNFDHCRLVVPYSADHSILTAYQTQWPNYSSIMIEEAQ